METHTVTKCYRQIRQILPLEQITVSKRKSILNFSGGYSTAYLEHKPVSDLIFPYLLLLILFYNYTDLSLLLFTIITTIIMIMTRFCNLFSQYTKPTYHVSINYIIIIIYNAPNKLIMLHTKHKVLDPNEIPVLTLETPSVNIEKSPYILCT